MLSYVSIVYIGYVVKSESTKQNHLSSIIIHTNSHAIIRQTNGLMIIDLKNIMNHHQKKTEILALFSK
ncbi:hypothetical protein BC833DRAFT_588131 [Globomyces pollinis-pini]|nr:hypothetical protein BC833DRAFT_588131 [Globomyces pollinis-pini]